MRALFSIWCDEYYNLRILLIGENLHNCRSKAILERRPFGRRKKRTNIWKNNNMQLSKLFAMKYTVN